MATIHINVLQLEWRLSESLGKTKINVNFLLLFVIKLSSSFALSFPLFIKILMLIQNFQYNDCTFKINLHVAAREADH